MKQLVRPNILSLAPYSCARDEFKGGNAETVFLDANESPYDNSERNTQEVALSPLNRYPDPLQREVKARVASLKGVPAENIFLGNGSDEAIDLVFRVFCRPGQDNVIVLQPSYGMYEVCADINDIECRKVSLQPDYSFRAADVLAAADDNTKAVFLCSPNNPTGNLLPREEILKVLTDFQGITVIDEAYIDFAADATWRSELPKFPRLLILSTFSKAWAAAGMRLGMAFGSAEMIGYFNKVKYPYNVNVLTQQMALELLENPERIETEIQTILAERERMAAVLPDLPCVEKVFPTDANFILVKVKGATEIYNYLAQSNIIVRNRHRVVLCADCLRITIGTPEENEAFLKVLKTFNS